MKNEIHGTTNKVLCDICDEAHIVTIEKKDDLFYCCNTCRDWEHKNNTNRDIRDNHFNESLVIDYCS